MSTCSIQDCKSPIKYAGLCQAHYYRQYRRRNPEACRKAASTYTKRVSSEPNREEQRRKRNESSNKYKTAHPYEMTRRSALMGGREFSISKESYLEMRSRGCHYCGQEITHRQGGLDRIDSAQGYVEGNVRPCCKPCNVAKNNMSEDAFKSLLMAIAKNYLKIIG